MRHIDDLRFEIEALKVHALRSNNEALLASANFMAETLDDHEEILKSDMFLQFLKEEITADD